MIEVAEWETSSCSGIGEYVSLVIAAKASDGVVLASDSRETISCAPYDAPCVRDDQRKVFQASGFGIGVVGAGQWLHGLIGSAVAGTSTVLGVATALRDQMAAQPNFPPVSCLCIRAGEPIGIVNSVGKRGDAIVWEPPAVLLEPWRCLGVSPIANMLMSAFWSAELNVTQVASVCAVAIAASAAYCFIGGPTQIIALRDDGRLWVDTDHQAALRGGKDWFDQAKALFAATPAASRALRATGPGL